MRVIFVRHGERDHSVPVASNVLIPLTERGREQARVTADALREEGIRPTAVLSSPFLRCMHTAEIMTDALGLQSFHVVPSLCELLAVHDFPKCHPREHLEGLHTRFGKAQLQEGDLPQWPEKENMFERRLHSSLRQLVDLHSEAATLICVAHGAFMEYLLSLQGLFVNTTQEADQLIDHGYPANLCIADVFFDSTKETSELRCCLSAGPLHFRVSHLDSQLRSGNEAYSMEQSIFTKLERSKANK
jgi:broad specificity phosphatase PhoE